MADNHGRFLAERVKHADGVRRHVQHAVGLDFLGRVGAAVAAKVRRNSMVSSGRERRKLVAPGVPQLRKPMKQQHQRTVPGLRDVHVDAVGLYRSVSDV